MLTQATRLVSVAAGGRGRALSSSSSGAAAAEGAGAGPAGAAPAARVFAWGQGTEGQLGHWPFEKSGITNSYVELSPRELRAGGKDAGHNALGFVDVAAGLNHTAAVTADGKVGGGRR